MAEILNSPGIQMTETDLSFVAGQPLRAGAAILGPTVKGPVLVPTRVSSYAQFVRLFGTTFEIETEEGVVKTQEYMTSMAVKNYFEQGGESVLVVRVENPAKFEAAQSNAITNNDGRQLFRLHTLAQGAFLNTQEEEGSLETREDGSAVLGSRDNFTWEIANVDEETGTFTLLIRRGNDTDDSPVYLETWQNVSLDPNKTNYIAAVIGDQKRVYVPAQDSADDPVEAYVDFEGNYPNKSSYVYVEVLNPTPGYLLADGSVNEEFEGVIPAEGRGGFFNGKGVPGDEPEAKLFGDIDENTTYPQGVECKFYEDAIALLQNQDEYIFNVISAPGALGVGSEDVRNGLNSLAQTRGDDIAVVDLATMNASVKQVADAASQINSSYAAAYWPWLQMYSATGRLEWVPASVVIPGVYAFTDRVAAPWFAPAGMTRGALGSVVQARKKLVKGDRDLLYKKNVNPIATLPGTGLVVYGQKTLQKKASALDRVNVRRLLIELKENIKGMASKILFEQNSAQVRNGFQAECESYLASVASRQGLYAYSVIVEPLNDPETIDRNEFRAQIAIQPTKVIEFIYINFVITATGVEFQDQY